MHVHSRTLIGILRPIVSTCTYSVHGFEMFADKRQKHAGKYSNLAVVFASVERDLNDY